MYDRLFICLYCITDSLNSLVNLSFLIFLDKLSNPREFVFSSLIFDFCIHTDTIYAKTDSAKIINSIDIFFENRADIETRKLELNNCDNSKLSCNILSNIEKMY